MKGLGVVGLIGCEGRNVAHQGLAHARGRRFARERRDGGRCSGGNARCGGRRLRGFLVFGCDESGLGGLRVRGQKLKRAVDGVESGVDSLEPVHGDKPAVLLFGQKLKLSLALGLKSRIVSGLLLGGDDRGVDAVRQVRYERREAHALGAQVDRFPAETLLEKTPAVFLAGLDHVAKSFHRGLEGGILDVVKNARDGGGTHCGRRALDPRNRNARLGCGALRNDAGVDGGDGKTRRYCGGGQSGGELSDSVLLDGAFSQKHERVPLDAAVGGICEVDAHPEGAKHVGCDCACAL